MRILILILSALLNNSLVFCQLEVKVVSKNNIIINNFKTKDSVELNGKLNDFATKYQNKGYITASVDSLIFDKNNVLIYFFIGEKYFWDTLTFYYPEKQVVNKKFKGEKVNFNKLEKVVFKEIEYFADNGYAFATADYKNLRFEYNEVDLDIFFQKNNFIVYDTILYPPETKITQKFLQNYLQIEKGKPYSEKNFKEIENKINALEFVELIQKPEIDFYDKSADVFLNIENVKANQVAGLVGFTTVNGKFTATGKADFTFVNTLKSADKISLQWQKNKELSQDLKFNIIIPYIFGTNLGVKNNFIIEKLDTSYVNISNLAEICYYFHSFNNASAYASFGRSIVFDTTRNFSDFSYLIYGLSLSFKKTDYFLNPSKGYYFNFLAGTGTKTAAEKNSNRTESVFDFGLYVPFVKKTTFFYRTYFYYLNGKEIFENELFKFGGANLLRGFDENSFTADLLFMNTLEFKFLFEKKSNFFIFADYAIFEHNVINNVFDGKALGIGTGINLGTKNNIFTFSYALGRKNGENFLFKNTKVHIGFKTVF